MVAVSSVDTMPCLLSLSLLIYTAVIGLALCWYLDYYLEYLYLDFMDSIDSISTSTSLTLWLYDLWFMIYNLWFYDYLDFIDLAIDDIAYSTSRPAVSHSPSQLVCRQVSNYHVYQTKTALYRPWHTHLLTL